AIGVSTVGPDALAKVLARAACEFSCSGSDRATYAPDLYFAIGFKIVGEEFFAGARMPGRRTPLAGLCMDRSRRLSHGGERRKRSGSPARTPGYTREFLPSLGGWFVPIGCA